MTAYLDNSATTPICANAREALISATDRFWGNPSSLHSLGTAAAAALDRARETVARSLKAEKEEIIFTGSGTLSDNTAIFGAAEQLKRRGNRIVTTAVEHPAVEASINKLERDGFEVIRLPVDSFCRIDETQLFEAINEKTVLVSMMYVNNETGARFPVNKIKSAVKRANAPALIHTDAVQAFGKFPISPSALGVDLLSASAHKVHGPKGAGLLWIRKGVRISPFVRGGGQENGLYSGTQSMPAILGFAGAVESFGDLNAQSTRVEKINSIITNGLRSLNGITLNSPQDASPYIINFSAPGHPSQTVLNYLSARGVFVSAGSACSKGHRSGVLKAMGLEPRIIDSALRVSLSGQTTEDEAYYFLQCLEDALNRLLSVGR